LFPHGDSKKIASCGPNNQADKQMDNLRGQISATGRMPSVVIVPSPKSGEQQHRQAKGQDAPVENIVLATLGSNPSSTLNLLRREYSRLE